MNKNQNKIELDKLTILRMVFFHLSLLLIFVVGVSQVAIETFIISYFLRSFAIAGGYHRYFSHQSYKTSRPFQFLLALFGTSTGQKGPLSWATSHINHHQHSDHEGDPHSPVMKNWFYAHFGWLFEKEALPTDPKLVSYFMKYPEIVFLNKYHFIGTSTLIISLCFWGAFLSKHYPNLKTSPLQMIYWGFIMSTFLILHGTCLINSVTHLFGYRLFKTKDNSRNIWWLFPITFGENWHNNHHYNPSMASNSVKWWEIDIVYGVICFLEKISVVWDVRHRTKIQ